VDYGPRLAQKGAEAGLILPGSRLGPEGDLGVEESWGRDRIHWKWAASLPLR